MPAISHVVEVVKGPERRPAQAAIERPGWRGECFEALDAPQTDQAPRRGVGELASPAPLPSGERPSFKGGGTPASTSLATTDDLMRLNTGWQLSPEQWRENAARRAVLKGQTERMAAALESHGVRVRKPLPVVALANVTGEIDGEESYRSICYLPLVAQRDRRGVLNALRWYQKHAEGGAYLRYAVVTAGARIPAWGDLRGAMTRLHRRVSRWAHEAGQEWGVEVIYRGTEFTRDGSATYHPHANVLYRPRRLMSEARWSAFLTWSRMRLGAHWQDNGRLTCPDEAIKYPFKPAELDRAESAELVWLWWETHRMKFAQPMGPFAEFRKRLDAEGRKVAMVNRRGGARLEIVQKAKRDPVEPAEGEGSQENAIICRTAPQFRFGPFAQPVTLVANFTETPTTPEGARRLSIIREWNSQARAWWDANGAPLPTIARAIAAGQVVPFKVHTRRPTVQTPAASGAFDPLTGEVIEGNVNGGAGAPAVPPQNRPVPPRLTVCDRSKTLCASPEALRSGLVPLTASRLDFSTKASALSCNDIHVLGFTAERRQDTQVVTTDGAQTPFAGSLAGPPRAGAPASGGLGGGQ